MAFLILLSTALFTRLEARNVPVKILNQYEASVSKLTLDAGKGAVEIITAKDGTVQLELPDSGIIRLAAPYHDTLELKAEGIRVDASIVLHKEFTWKDLINPMFYIVYGGLWLLLFIIFAETGLFAGFFLPGDSLLFVAGIYSANLANEFLKLFALGGIHNEWLDLLLLIALVTVAGILGNYVGYWFGRKIGPAMFHWNDNLLYKKKYLHQAHDFYEKHGGGAIVVARFIPIIRTFAPIVSGIVEMNKKVFTFYNIAGCVAWVSSMILAGHFLQQWILSQFKFNLKDHLEIIVIGIVIVSTLPVIIKLITGSKKK